MDDHKTQSGAVSKLYRGVRSAVHAILYLPKVKKVLTRLAFTRPLYPTWERRHPVDDLYGVETSGFLSVEEIHPDPAVSGLIMPYCGSQPSIVRTALAALGDVSDYVFADLGCGKGRAAIVGSEFGFREVIGVELSPALAKVARANAEIIAAKFPNRPRIQIFETNVLDFSFPEGKLALFLYHPFKDEILSTLIGRLEKMAASGWAQIFIVYYNPVHFDLLDESTRFQRCFAESVPYHQTELGCGTDTSDKVTVWKSIGPYQSI